MSFRQDQTYGKFRESLRYEDHVHNQLEECRKTFNIGGALLEMRAVKSLMLLITPQMEDEEFLEDIQELNDKWTAERKRRQKVYQKEVRAAGGGCPDLISPPSEIPDEDHWEEMFMVCAGLLERKGLMLEQKTKDAV